MAGIFQAGSTATAASIFIVLFGTASVFADGMTPHSTETSTGTAASEAPFLAENDAAMAKMMSDMAVKPTGDVDRDFVAMMVPHHQGAIDMAEVILRYGGNETLKRLAQEIIVTQQQEIAAMRLAVNEPLPASVASPTQIEPSSAAAASTGDQPSMSTGMDPDMKMGN